MWLLSNLVLFLVLGVATWALHESDVGIVDWNKHYIGVPLAGSVTTAPAFHHVGNETIILTATGSNVLAALKPEDGSVRMCFGLSEIDAFEDKILLKFGDIFSIRGM